MKKVIHRYKVLEITSKLFTKISKHVIYAIRAERNLRNHIKCVHQEGIKFFKCDSCEKRFSLSTILRKHIKSVHNGVNFACDSCNKTFVSAGNLKMHQKSVHDNLRFICNACHKSFATAQNLKAHKK